MVLLKILTTILILLFPLGELGRINVYNEISTTVNDILVGLLMFIWLSFTFLKNEFSEISKNKLFKPILFFISVAFLSLILGSKNLNSSEFFASFLYLLRFSSYAAIYFIVSSFDMKFKQKIVILLIFSGSMVVLGGFIQYFLYPSLRNLYYLGWDEHLYRLFSSFLDPNFAAVIISLFLTLLLSLLFVKSRNHFRFSRVFLIVLSILSFIALLLTYSRGGYLMFLVSFFVLLFLLGKKKHVVFLLLIFALGLTLIPKNLGGEGVKLLRTASFISRTQYANNAITIIKDNPILGVGFNSYRYTQYRYGFIDDSNVRVSHAGAGTDNSFLFVLATTGIVGFSFYLYMWFRTIKKSFEEPTISIAIIASSVGLLVSSLFNNLLFYPFIMEWMWILIGLRENK